MNKQIKNEINKINSHTIFSTKYCMGGLIQYSNRNLNRNWNISYLKYIYIPYEPRDNYTGEGQGSASISILIVKISRSLNIFTRQKVALS